MDPLRIVLAAGVLAIIVAGLGLFFGLFDVRAPWLDDWYAVGWNPCSNGTQTSVQICLDPGSGQEVDPSRCPHPRPVVTRSCVPGESPPIRCCNSAGRCENIPAVLYQEGYTCCGVNYGDFGGPPSGMHCCHHGTEEHPTGCSANCSDSANTCFGICGVGADPEKAPAGC